jgi:hypothetical protein
LTSFSAVLQSGGLTAEQTLNLTSALDLSMLVISGPRGDGKESHTPVESDGWADLRTRKNKQIEQPRYGNAQNAFGALLPLQTIKDLFSICIRSPHHIAETK